MNEYEVIGWPEIQEIMDEDGFEDNATLITINEAMGIGPNTFLVNKKWLEE